MLSEERCWIMFFHTHPRMLRPVHSLLANPFGFSAHASVSGPLQPLLNDRADYDAMLALCQLYDRARKDAAQKMGRLKPLLADRFTFIASPDSDISGICQTTFDGLEPTITGIPAGRFQGLVSVQCQLERLYDLHNVRKTGKANILRDADAGEVLRLLMLNEALALCLTGIAQVREGPDGFTLSVLDKKATDSLRATWFARNAEQSSHVATIAMAATLANGGASTVSDVLPLIDRILDQDLSIQLRHVEPAGRALQSTQEVIHAVAFIAVATVAEIRGQPLSLLGSKLKRLGLDPKAVERLLYRQAHALATDRFAYRRGNDLTIRVDSASKGLRNYYLGLEEEFNERALRESLVGGEFFEKRHIRQRIEQGDDYLPRYRIVDGFDRYQVLDDVENKKDIDLDIEFIIHDTQQDHFYFVQAKHALLGEKAFFDSVIKAVQTRIGFGINQLRGAKALLNQGLLTRTLAARELNDVTPAKCSFVLLHNIAQFDYQSTGDGIALYEWASFRNLLKDAEWAMGSSHGDRKLVRLPSPLVVDDPLNVIDRLLAEHPYFAEASKEPWINERASTTYSIQGKTVRVRGLGI